MHALKDLVVNCDEKEFEKIEEAACELLQEKQETESVESLISALSERKLDSFLTQEVLNQIRKRRADMDRAEERRKSLEEKQEAQDEEYISVMKSPDFKTLCKEVMALEKDLEVGQGKFDFDFTLKFKVKGNAVAAEVVDVMYNAEAGGDEFQPFEFENCELTVLETPGIGKEQVEIVQEFVDVNVGDVCGLVAQLNKPMRDRMKSLLKKAADLNKAWDELQENLQHHDVGELFDDFKEEIESKKA